MPLDLIFVCVSNRVRSVFAEFLFGKMLRERDEGLAGEIDVASAGFMPERIRTLLASSHIGSPQPFYNRDMSQITRRALGHRGIAVPAQWRSKALTPEKVIEADLIVTALPDQKRELLDRFPTLCNKVFTFREMSKSEKYLLQEDFSAVPMDDSFWDYCEENEDYVSRIILEMEGILQSAFPHILRELLKQK
jgi:protein-tyrosine-phosphatase